MLSFCWCSSPRITGGAAAVGDSGSMMGETGKGLETWCSSAENEEDRLRAESFDDGMGEG